MYSIELITTHTSPKTYLCRIPIKKISFYEDENSSNLTFSVSNISNKTSKIQNALRDKWYISGSRHTFSPNF